MQDAITAAVEAAQSAYDSADKNPMDHGFAHVEGLDGRTTLARELRAHPDVDAEDSSYVTVDGLHRYLGPQQQGYRAFVRELREADVDGAEDLRVRGRLD